MEIGAIWGTVGLDPGPLQKGLTKAEKSLTGFKSKAAKLAAGAGVAIAGGIGASVVAGMNLEPAGKKLVAQLRLSGEEAKRVSALAGKVYADNWGESMDDAAGRVGAVITSIDGMADATDEVAMRTIAAISGLTDTMELDFDRTTQVIGQMMRTGMVKDAVAGADLLAVTMSRVPKAVREDVLDAVDEYGPFFQQLGIEGEAAMAMLAKGAEKGMYGIDKTGDAIKELTIRATDGSAASSAAFETMGLNAQAMASAFATGGETAKGALDRTIDGLLSIEDPAVRAQTAIALFGTPLEDLNVGEIPEFLRGLKQTGDALGDTGGAATQMGDTLNSSASANIERFKRQIINTAVNAIGNHFLPAISAAAGWAADNFGPAVKGAGEALKAFGGWVKDNASWLTPLGAGLATVAAGLALLALQAKIVAAGGLIKFIIGAITSTNAWAVAQAALNLVMSANPLALVVIAIAAVVAALITAYKTSDTFRAVVDKVFSFVWDLAKKLASWFKDKFSGTFKALWSLLKAGWEHLRDAVGAVFGAIRSAAHAVAHWFTNNFVGTFTRMFSGLAAKWTAFKDMVGDKMRAARDAAGRQANAIKDGLKETFRRTVRAVGDVFSKITDKIKAPLKKAMRWVNSTFIGKMNGMLSKVGISWKIPKLKGFARGGYTGHGGKYEPAGIVHKGEVVWSQEDVKAWGGAGFVDALRQRKAGVLPRGVRGDAEGFMGVMPNLPGYAKGGIVGDLLSKAGGLTDMIMHPKRAVGKAVDALLSHMPDFGMWGKVIAAALRKIPQGIAKKIDNLFTSGDFAGGSGGAWGPVAGNVGIGGKLAGLHPVLLRRLGAWNRALGGKFSVGSGYRSIASQAALYRRWKAGVPGQAKAAPPGRSMHNFGLAVDLSPSRTTARERALGAKFGLYWPMSFEPWHVQAVGLKKPRGYAHGTMNAVRGMAAVGEKGPELVTSPQYRAFSGGESVIPLRSGSSRIDAAELRKALSGMAIDIDNGRIFFDKHMARVERDNARRRRSASGVMA